MWILLDIMEICNLEECVGRIDGRYILREEQIQVEEGSFLQIFIGPSDEQASPQESEECLMDVDSEEEVRHDSHVTTRGPTSLADDTRSTLDYVNQAPFLMLAHIAMTIGLQRAHFPYRQWAMQFTTAVAFQLPVHRIGEAQHPGPDIWLGTTNPTGMRGKERAYYDLPTGVWCVSETHLTELNQRDVTGTFHKLNQEHNRSLRVLHGAPVQPRSARSSAGTWAGVSIVTDLICKPVGIYWQQSEYALGRAQVCQVWCGPFSITTANLYGWPESPTWPRATEATENSFWKNLPVN